MLGDCRRRAERRSRHSARDWRWFAARFLAGTFCSGVAWLTLGSRGCAVEGATAGQGREHVMLLDNSVRKDL